MKCTRIIVLVAFFTVLTGTTLISYASTLVKVTGVNFTMAGGQALSVPHLLVSNTWTIVERFRNPHFSQGLDNWQMTGAIKLVSDAQNHWVKIGMNGFRDDNSLSQTILLTPDHPTHLIVEYRLLSQEDLSGFDDPCLKIAVNDTIVRQSFCRNLNNQIEIDGQMYHASGWLRFFYDLQQFSGESLTLKIMAGNTIDDELGSGVVVRLVSTQTAIIRPTTELAFNSTEPVTYRWGTLEQTWQPGERFKITTTTPSELLFWTTAHPQQIQRLPIKVDNSPPTTWGGIGYYHNFDESYSLLWYSPGEDVRYEIRTADNWLDFYTQPWSSFPLLKLVSEDFDSMSLVDSQPLDTQEIYHTQPGLKPTWLGLKTKNLAGVYSEAIDVVELK